MAWHRLQGGYNISHLQKFAIHIYYIKNGWIDNQRRVFIYYSIKNICEDLNCGTQKACKLLDELEKVGALERKRQGLGRPNKLYLKKMF